MDKETLQELLTIIKNESEAYDDPEHEMYTDWAEKAGAQMALHDMAKILTEKYS